MILNGVIAFILRYFTKLNKFDSFATCGLYESGSR